MTISSKAFAVVTPNDSAHTSLTSGSFNSTGYTHVVVFAKHELGATTIAPADNKSSVSWSNSTKRDHSNGDIHVQFFWAAIGAPGTGHTVTLTFGATVQYSRVGVWLVNVTGGGSLALDVEAGAEGSGTAIDAGTLATSAAAALFMGVGEYSASSFTPGTGWTEDWDLAGAGGSYSFGQSRLETAAGTFDPACTESALAPWLAHGIALREAAAPPPPASLPLPNRGSRRAAMLNF